MGGFVAVGNRVRREGGTPAARRLLIAAALFVLLSLVLQACAGNYGNNPFQGGAGQNEIQVTIRNQNFSDATVWAVWRAGSRARLGSVTGNSTRTFSTPWRGDVIQFEVDFLGGRRYTTQSYPVNEGDHLELTLRP